MLTIGDTAANGGTQTFTYDALERLATAMASGGYGAYAQQSYGWTERASAGLLGMLYNPAEA